MHIENHETDICFCQTYMQKYKELDSQYLVLSMLPNITSSFPCNETTDAIFLNSGSYEIFWELSCKEDRSSTTLFLHHTKDTIPLPSICNYGLKHQFMDMGGKYSFTIEKPSSISFSLQTQKKLYECSFYLTIVKKEQTL